MTYRHATIFSCLALMLVFAFPHGAQAKLTSCESLPAGVTIENVQNDWIRLQLSIPNVTVNCTDDNDTTATSDDVTKGYIKDVGAYIGGLYKYFVGVVGVIAALMVFYGGLRWLSAGGNASHVKEAKETIFSALIAIVIAFGSYTLLYTINPKLVVINPPVLKVADTFLVSFDNSCSTTKVCLSGTNIGKSCTTDAACPGAGSGACALPIELEGAAEPVCGVRYRYKNILGVKTTSETCIGNYCAGEAFGTQVCSSSNQSSTTLIEGAECVMPLERCNAIIDDFADDSACPAFSIAVKDPTNNPDSVLGAGKCRWIDVSWIDINEPDDRCTWYPALGCDAGFERVGCGECNNVGVECPDVEDITYDGEFAGVAGETPAKCISSASEAVYAADKTGDGQNLKGICCHKKLTAMTKENLQCISNSSPPPNL